jgi:hypothetical protein
MFEFLNKLEGGEIIGLVAVTGGLLVAIIATAATQWRRVRVAEIEASLKQQMLDKGMSAAEIEAVMRAGQEVSGFSSTSTGNEAVDRAALVQRMVDEGYGGEDIERVLKAYNVSPKSPEVQAVANKA